MLVYVQSKKLFYEHYQLTRSASLENKEIGNYKLGLKLVN